MVAHRRPPARQELTWVAPACESLDDHLARALTVQRPPRRASYAQAEGLRPETRARASLGSLELNLTGRGKRHRRNHELSRRQPRNDSERNSRGAGPKVNAHRQGPPVRNPHDGIGRGATHRSGLQASAGAAMENHGRTECDEWGLTDHPVARRVAFPPASSHVRSRRGLAG